MLLHSRSWRSTHLACAIITLVSRWNPSAYALWADIKPCLGALQEFHIGKLRSNLDAGGDASLMNGLDMAVDSLKSIPTYGHREVFEEPFSVSIIVIASACL